MSAFPLRGAAAIVGTGLAGYPDGGGLTHLELMAQATHAALADAGLSLRDIDGLFTTNLVSFMPALAIQEYLGLTPRWVDSTQIGGASFVHYATAAAMALHLGLCKVALIVYGSDAGSNPVVPLSIHDPLAHEIEYGATFPVAGLGLAAMRHMALYGTRRSDMAAYVQSSRRWAALNPMLPSRPVPSIEEIVAAPIVADPFSLYDIGQMTDGAAAVIMVARERAADMRGKPVYFLGGGTAVSHRRFAQAEDLPTTKAVESGARAYEMAGVGPGEIDVCQFYDGFSIYPILFAEDLGFCAKGEGGAFVSSGALAPGGRLPVNTNGGSLCSVHPGMYGLFLLVECARQLRGDGGPAQVAGARIGLCQGTGGHLASQSTAIFSIDPP